MKQKTDPTLIELFIASVRYIAMLDAQKTDETLDELKAENDSFYERVVRTFVKVASTYYKDELIKQWVKDNLVDTKKLPDLNLEI